MIVSYLLFVGMWMYFATSVMFFWLFTRTLRTKDGIGLLFLKFLTGSIMIGSFVIFIIRYLSEYGQMSMELARAIAIINPVILFGVGLYLNFLFHQKYDKKKTEDEKNKLKSAKGGE